jgi:hypothetical protein
MEFGGAVKTSQTLPIWRRAARIGKCHAEIARWGGKNSGPARKCAKKRKRIDSRGENDQKKLMLFGGTIKNPQTLSIWQRATRKGKCHAEIARWGGGRIPGPLAETARRKGAERIQEGARTAKGVPKTGEKNWESALGKGGSVC